MTRTPNGRRPARRTAIALVALASASALAACANSSSLEGSADSGASSSSSSATTTLAVGSQDYYSNEIIAETYAQALEAAGYTVDRQFRIGQREVYMPEIQSGSIDVFPEYTGNLLQYLDSTATATKAEDVYAALAKAIPSGLRVLDAAPATDQDTYVVTKEFADAHSASSIADLKGVDGLVLGGNSELETRPYGPKGLASVYGVNVSFTPIEDSGGALTLKALRDGSVQLVDVYSADPALASSDLVALADPEGMFLASQVVPVVSSRVDADAAAVINTVSAALDPADLVEMNRESTQDAASASAIAKKWLAAEGIVK